jgi:hypothetical protein
LVAGPGLIIQFERHCGFKSHPLHHFSQGHTMKVQFAPGAFDDFDGTQEELNALKAEIEETFESLTSEELAAQSRKVDFADLPDHVQDNLIDKPRTLQ